MPAYSFKKRFADPILSNQKLQTIREVGKRRHARAGERIQIYTGMRTKQCKLIATRICSSVHQILLLIMPRQEIEARIDGKVLGELELNALVRADGFEDVADMWKFWRDNHKGVDKFDGLLIKWEPGRDYR